MIYAKILAALLFSTALVFGAGSVPLKNAVLTSPLDGGGQSITNVVIPDYVSTNDPKYLAAITNVPENIATLDDVTNIVDSALEPYALTNHQHDASDITGSTWITDADTNGWETGSHADLVTDALEDLGGDTNAWHDYEYLRKDGDWINPFVNFMSVDQSRAILQTLGKTMELIATSTNGAPCVGTYTWNVTNLYEFGGTGSIGYWTSDGVTGGPYAFYAMAGDGQWNQWKIFRVSDQGTYWIGQSLNGVETTIEGDGSKYNGISGIASGTDVQVAIKLLPESSGGSSAPSAIFVPWYEQAFNDSGFPIQWQLASGDDLIYCVRQDYSNSVSPTRLNMKLGRSVEGDVWTITHHAGPQTGTNVTFNVLYAITKGQATPTTWTYTNSVTATWNATNMYDHEIQHTLTNSIVGTNSVRLWISKGDSALGSGYWYWGDTTVEVAR